MADSRSDEKPRKREEEKSSKEVTVRNSEKQQSLKVIKSEEARRNLKWVSFTRAKVSFGFQHLSAAYVPAMLEEPRGYCICLENVSGWTIPSAVLKEFGKGDYEITAQLSFSMFHLSSSTFFGTTWMGPSVVLGRGNTDMSKTFDFEYADIVYMLSRITDPTCVGIIEIVVSKFDLRTNLVAAQFGCGWTIVNLFMKPTPADIAEGHENVAVTNCALFTGSPRDLIINTDLKTLASRLKEIPDCWLHCKLFSHRRLLKAHRLIAENEALGRFDTVAGLVPRPVAPPGSTQARPLPCLGDEVLRDDRSGDLSLPAVPRLATPCTLKIGNCQLYMPNRRAVEIKMCEEYAGMLQMKDASKVLVISRKLRVGLHNGNTVLGGDWQSHTLSEDKHDADVLFTPTKSEVSVEGYVPDMYMAVAFMVEYELGIPAPQTTHFNSQAMMRSTTWQDGRMVTSFTVCAAIFIPCNGTKLLLKNTGRRQVDEDGVDIELPLLKDEVCTILSAKPFLLFNDKTGEGRDGLDAQTKGRTNLRAGEKESDGDGRGNVLEEEDNGSPMLGFDLRVFHPSEGEIMHGDDITALLQLDSKKAKVKTSAEDEDRALEETRKSLHERGKDAKDGSDDERDRAVDALGGTRTFRASDSNFRERGFTVTSRNEPEDLRESRGTFRSRRRDDDNDSVADSIVTGESGHSSLRLDALYYTSMGRTRDPRSYMGQDAWDTFSERSSEAGVIRGTIRDSKFTIPKNKDSLLAQSLQAKLVTKDRAGMNLNAPSELLPTNRLPYEDNLRIAPKTSIVGINSNAAHVRELSRGARSRLSRHGFDGAIQDTPLSAVLGDSAPGSSLSKHRNANPSGKNVVVDIEMEARDELSMHEINIQFAGYRAGSSVKKSASPVMDHYTPKAVYCSFQFYSCMPTRTEVMRLLPAEAGELSVLARDEAHVRDEPPLTLRFFVDCSTASPNEATEFAEYLAHSSLYVDVWDADSLLHLGTCGIPLRRLMRQGQRVVKQAAECDVINAELGAVSQANGGISSTIIAENGPASGTIVGTVQLIISNAGHEGKGRKPRKGSKDDFAPLEGLNWRAFGVAQDARDQAAQAAGSNRPRNSVRAKPLSESSPELHKALADVRHSADHKSGGASLRSLTDLRGASGGSTLTYDEVSILFKRFRGAQKGTVQYAGDLLSLLDMPSLAVALKKLIQAYRKYADYDGLLKEILRHSNAASELSAADAAEALKVMFERAGVSNRPEELTLLTEKLLAFAGGKSHVSAQQMVDFCADEADRHEWTLVGNRLRLCAQKAALDGEDLEQQLCDLDSTGSHYITSTQFKKFLSGLGSLAPKDVNLCCRHFSRRPPQADEDRGTVSLREVMAFLGSEYVGNLQARIRKVLQGTERGCPDVREMLAILNSSGSTARPKDAPLVYTYDEVEAAFSMLGIYKEISHDQGRAVIKKMDAKTAGKITAAQLLTYLGIPFKASDLTSSAAAASTAAVTAEAYQDLDAEGLLRLLLDKVQSNGVAVDEAFRHFDINGDGSITRQELVQGLTKLRIFDNVPNWKTQLPALMKKFDVDGNGEVSLREFFKFLGIVEYAPNIIQRMTKIFAVAAQKNVSVKDIFVHLDSDGSGQLDAKEIEAGLKALGTFGEVTRGDADAVVNHFDKDGDKQVSIDEFVAYFTERVNQAIAERNKKRADRATAMLRKTFAGAISKGAQMREIFAHLDKDKSGSIDIKELMATIKQLPSFKKMGEADMNALLDVLDSDKSGDISFDEFEAFLQVDDGSALEDSMSSVGPIAAPATLLDRIRDTFKLAEEHGLSFEKAFNLLDKDSSGGITVTELHAALLKLPNFKNVTLSEVRELHETIDTNRNGDVSIEEFRVFVKEGRIYSPRTRDEKNKAAQKRLEEDKGGKLTPEMVRELFIRHMNRVSRHDGGVSGLLAYLDDDEDGLIALTTFKALLRREDVFDAIPEDQVVDLLAPMMQDHKNLRAAALLRFVEGSKMRSHRDAGEGKEAENDTIVLPKEYEFSSNPEIRALEKKVRGFGRVLAKKGVDVESMFRSFDPKSSGSVRRTELLEVLSKLGMYLLEQGRVLDEAASGGNDIQRMQMHQVNRLKGKGGDYLQNAPRMARRMLMNGGNGAPEGDFKEHLESMTLVNWYRQSQKQMLLQRVLSHSLAHVVHIYPRFGKTQFFEYPITNPFAHEERFQIEINDPELRLVTAFDEWLHLRRACRPAVGELGSEPVEADMFDRDASGNFQVALLPHETLYIPFTFMTLLPFVPAERHSAGRHPGSQRRSDRFHGESKRGDDDRQESEGKSEEDHGASSADKEEPQRTVEVKVLSGTHGHIVSILKIQICPRPFVLNRTLRFQEPENSIMKRRIQIVGHENMSLYPGEYSTAAKYVHCVEGGVPMAGTAGVSAAQSTGIVSVAGEDASRETQSRVVVEWGPSSEHFSGAGALDLLIRYRCGAFPSTGTFYLLIYSDPYQSQLHEVWQVVVQTRQRLDVHGSVGCASLADLVVRGDRFARRARAYALPSPADVVHFRPDTVFQLVPGAYNRVALSVSPKVVGYRHIQLNLVDEDSRELVSAWLLTVAATSPAVMRSYDVDVPAGRPLHKKIVFKNPWDVPRVFRLSSSDEALMRPRTATVEVAALGTAYLRLWFSGLESGGAGQREVHLFLNDAAAGQNEECYLFRIRDV